MNFNSDTEFKRYLEARVAALEKLIKNNPGLPHVCYIILELQKELLKHIGTDIEDEIMPVLMKRMREGIKAFQEKVK